MNRKELSFTLIELLIVVTIITILAAILLPTLIRAKQKAGLTVCASNERQLGLATFLYNKDNNNAFPRRVIPKIGGGEANWAIWIGPNHPDLLYKNAFSTADRPLNTYIDCQDDNLTEGVFRCPSELGTEQFWWVGNSYWANTAYGPGHATNNTKFITLSQSPYSEKYTEIPDPVEMVLFSEPGAAPLVNGADADTAHTENLEYNLLFIDGHVGLKELSHSEMQGNGFSFIHPESSAYSK